MIKACYQHVPKEQGYGHQYDFISTRENVDKANMRGIELQGNWTIHQNGI